MVSSDIDKLRNMLTTAMKLSYNAAILLRNIFYSCIRAILSKIEIL